MNERDAQRNSSSSCALSSHQASLIDALYNRTIAALIQRCLQAAAGGRLLPDCVRRQSWAGTGWAQRPASAGAERRRGTHPSAQPGGGARYKAEQDLTPTWWHRCNCPDTIARSQQAACARQRAALRKESSRHLPTPTATSSGCWRPRGSGASQPLTRRSGGCGARTFRGPAAVRGAGAALLPPAAAPPPLPAARRHGAAAAAGGERNRDGFSRLGLAPPGSLLLSR